MVQRRISCLKHSFAVNWLTVANELRLFREPFSGTSFGNQFREPVSGTSFGNQFREPVLETSFGNQFPQKKVGAELTRTEFI
jgi:hypothetical protein